MTGVKRGCPFGTDNGDIVFNANGDVISISVKRFCSQDRVEGCQRTEDQGMDYQVYTEVNQPHIPHIQVQRGSPTVELNQTSQQTTNKNFLTAPKPCGRCQAGEPGHFSHIGR